MKYGLVDGLVDELLSKKRSHRMKQIDSEGIGRFRHRYFVPGLVDGLVDELLKEVKNQ